jgi:NAD+ kinase
MPYTFNTIGLIGKFGDPSVADTLAQIANYLRRLNLRVLVDEASAKFIPSNDLEVATRYAIGQECDLAIAMGGDGTLPGGLPSTHPGRQPGPPGLSRRRFPRRNAG